MNRKFYLGDLGAPPDSEDYLKTFAIPYALTYTEDSWDWRDHGIVTPAKDQGGCGSCWAFTSVGLLESRILMMGGPTLDLSEQQLVSLSDAGTCGGGTSAALRYWYDRGPFHESCAPYAASNIADRDITQCSECRYRSKGYYTVDTDDENEIMLSIRKDGPAYFSFNAYDDFFDFWYTASQGDVYICQNDPNLLGRHAVLLIGWDQNIKALLCKNSWGQNSGPNGDGTFWIAWDGHDHDLSFHMASIDAHSFGLRAALWTHLSNGDGFEYKSTYQRMAGFWDSQKWLVGDFNDDERDEMDDLINVYGVFLSTED